MSTKYIYLHTIKYGHNRLCNYVIYSIYQFVYNIYNGNKKYTAQYLSFLSWMHFDSSG